jgi:hypothetical protein
VLSIWEGTTNVLALDAIRACAKGDALGACAEEVRALAEQATAGDLPRAGRAAVEAVAHARAWLARATVEGTAAVETGARRFALTLGRALEVALLARHAQWSLQTEGDGRAAAAALRLARHGIDLVADDVSAAGGASDAAALANDTPL